MTTEHSPNELPMVPSQLQAMEGGTATPVVRVPWNDMVMIKRYLDIGAQTLLLPYVQTPEEAKDAVRYTRYGLARTRLRCACGKVQVMRDGGCVMGDRENLASPRSAGERCVTPHSSLGTPRRAA